MEQEKNPNLFHMLCYVKLGLKVIILFSWAKLSFAPVANKAYDK